MLNIYFEVLVLLLVLSIFQYFKSKQRWPVFIGAIGLALLAGFRRMVGPDTPVYLQNYMRQREQKGFSGQFEFGYSHLAGLFSKAGIPPTVFFLVVALLSLLLIAVFFNENAEWAMFSLSYYYTRTFFSRDMNQIRQALATAIVLMSIRFLKRKEFIRFSAVVILAAQFHVVAYVMFIPYVLINWLGFNRENLTRYSLWMLGSAFLFSLVAKPALTLFVHLVGRGSSYVDGTITGSALSALPLVAFQVGIAILMLIYNKKSTNYNLLIRIYVIGVSITVAFAQMPTFGTRVSSVLTVVEAVLFIPAIAVVLGSKFRKIMLPSLVGFIIFMFYMNLIRDGYIEWFLPYGNPMIFLSN